MSETKQCPFCAEEIKADARVCKFCKKDLEGREDLLRKASNEILRWNTKWSVRSQNEESIHLLYTEKGKSADCCSTCCLAFIFFPFAILYAILGGNPEKERQVELSIEDGKLLVSGHPYYSLIVFKKLVSAGFAEDIIESEDIIRARKWKMFLRK